VQQKRLDSSRLLYENLIGEIIQHEAMAPGKGRQKSRDINAALQGKGGQLQARNPTLRAAFEGSNVSPRQIETHTGAQTRAGFFRREPQIARSQLGELPTNPQARQWQGRIGSGGENEVELWWQVLDQCVHGTVKQLSSDDVVVIEDQGEISHG
jgi:hypothetical protein